MVVLGVAAAAEAAACPSNGSAAKSSSSDATHTASSTTSYRAAVAAGEKLLKSSHGGASLSTDDVRSWLQTYDISPATLADQLAAHGIGQSALPPAVRDVLATTRSTPTPSKATSGVSLSAAAKQVATTKAKPKTVARQNASGPSSAPAAHVAAPTPSPTRSATKPTAPAASPTPSPSKASTPVLPTVPAKSAIVQGRPGAGNTGVPAGVKLQSSGALNITTPGTVIDGLDISGCVTIDAANVTIKNSRIHCSTNASVVSVSSGNLIMSHSEIDGEGRAAQCISFSNYTLDAVDIHGCADGAKFASNVVIRNSYIHDLARGDGTHNDALQTMGGHDDVIEGNTLLAYSAADDDPMNAALHSGHITSDLRNVRVSNNYMDGGNYTVNAGATTTGGNSISGYVFTDNVFGPHSRYGAVASLGSGVSFDSSNVWASNGQPVR
jgi:hypothetical protein